MQDPQIQLGELGIALKDAIDPSKDAVLDAAHRSMVNWETFFFADLDAKRRFDDDPIAYCGVLRDPVSRQRFRPGDASPTSMYDGRRYYFWTEATKTEFDGNPKMYATANFDMIMM